MTGTTKDNPREKLMRETARVILQTIFDCPESEREDKILQLANGFAVHIEGADKNQRKFMSV